MTMEKITKELKSLSNFLAFLALMQLLNLITNFDAINQIDTSMLNGVDFAAMGIAATTMMTIVKVMYVVPSVLGILILLYLCIKGHKEANDPSPAKLHLVLAVICAVCHAFGALETLFLMFNNSTDLLLNILEMLLGFVTSALLFYYFAYAKKIRTRE